MTASFHDFEPMCNPKCDRLHNAGFTLEMETRMNADVPAMSRVGLEPTTYGLKVGPDTIPTFKNLQSSPPDGQRMTPRSAMKHGGLCDQMCNHVQGASAAPSGTTAPPSHAAAIAAALRPAGDRSGDWLCSPTGEREYDCSACDEPCSIIHRQSGRCVLCQLGWWPA